MTDADEGALDALSTSDMQTVLAVLEGRRPGKLRDRPYAIGRLRRALAEAEMTLEAAVEAAGVGRPPPDAEPLDEAGWMAELGRIGAEAVAEMERQAATVDWEAELTRNAAEVEALLGLGPGPGGRRPSSPAGGRRR